jgi:hypothetical protein
MSCDEETYDFSLQLGDDETVTFRYLSDNAPVDINGMDFVFECAVSTLNQTMSLSSPTTLGEFTASFARANTAGLLARRVRYRVLLWQGGIDTGTREVLFKGSINFKPEVV